MRIYIDVINLRTLLTVHICNQLSPQTEAVLREGEKALLLSQVVMTEALPLLKLANGAKPHVKESVERDRAEEG